MEKKKREKREGERKNRRCFFKGGRSPDWERTVTEKERKKKEGRERERKGERRRMIIRMYWKQ